MKRVICGLFLQVIVVALVFLPRASVAKEEPAGLVKMAILQFDSIGAEGKDDGKGRMVSEFMTTAAVGLGVFNIVERELVKKIVDEMEFGSKAQNYSSVAQKIGTLAGADYVLSGSVTAYKGNIRIDARLVRVLDGTIMAAYGASSNNDLDSIFEKSKHIIDKVLEVIIPTVSQMVVGQSAWALPEAMVVDKQNKLWIEKKAAIRYESNARFCMQVTKTSNGFGVNTMKCDVRYKQVNIMDINSMFPITSIQY